MSSLPDPRFIDASNAPQPSETTAESTPLTESADRSFTPAFFRFVAVTFLAGALSGGALFWFFGRPAPPPIQLMPPPTSQPSPTPLPTPTPAPLVVYVSGEVAAPGVYQLTHDARVGDALTAAGGLTPTADGDLVNQAERLWDGAQVHVPALVPVSVESTAAASQPAPGLSGGSGPPPQSADSGPSGPSSGLININTASQAELESLPGIGPAKAQAIIAARPYASVQDLTQADGIGEKTLASLADLIVTE